MTPVPTLTLNTPSAFTVLPPAAKRTVTDESHHRIANNLQLLAAMVSIEARRVADPLALAALTMTQRRIAAIAGVHRHLYQAGDPLAVDLAAYLQSLGEDLQQCCADPAAGRNIVVSVEPVTVSSDDATALGILVSELVGNACKYAYQPGQPGDVWITLSAMPFGGYRLDVSDRGRGIVAGAAPQGTGFGARLIEMVATRLNASYAWHDAAPGTLFSLFV